MTPTLSINDWTQLVLIATVLLSLAKPLLEQIPGLRPTSKNHDALLVALNFLICLGLVIWKAPPQGSLTFAEAYAYLAYTVQQFAGSQTVYHVLTTSGLSIGNSSLKQTVGGLLGSGAPPTASPSLPPQPAPVSSTQSDVGAAGPPADLVAVTADNLAPTSDSAAAPALAAAQQ